MQSRKRRILIHQANWSSQTLQLKHFVEEDQIISQEGTFIYYLHLFDLGTQRKFKTFYQPHPLLTKVLNRVIL